MTHPLAAVAAAIGAACAVCAAGAEQGRAVEGKALREMFAGHEFGDGVHFAYRFRADGTFSGTEMAKDVRGTWRLSGGEICWTWTQPRGAEECYVARKSGAEVSLFRNGFEQWYGTLKPIRSQPLGGSK
jgi:hypothetical protein